MMKRRSTYHVALAALLAPAILDGCVAPSSQDDLEGEDDLIEDDKADAGGTTGYYWIESTKQGTGALTYRVHRANGSSLRCTDGVTRAACDAAAIDDAAIALTPAEKAGLLAHAEARKNTGEPVMMVRGAFAATTFKATEIWRQYADLSDSAARDRATAEVAVKVTRNTGCAVTPCRPLAEAKLNSTRRSTIDRVPIPDAALDERARGIIEAGGSILVAGSKTTTSTRSLRRGDAVYLQLGTAQGPATSSCASGAFTSAFATNVIETVAATTANQERWEAPPWVRRIGAYGARLWTRAENGAWTSTPSMNVGYSGQLYLGDANVDGSYPVALHAKTWTYISTSSSYGELRRYVYYSGRFDARTGTSTHEGLLVMNGGLSENPFGSFGSPPEPITFSGPIRFTDHCISVLAAPVTTSTTQVMELYGTF